MEMEDKVCSFDKFGFCKYKKECRRKHFRDECEDLGNCKSIKIRNKRHPKNCKRDVYESCKFKNDCAYKHLNKSKIHDQEQIREKVKVLENVVQELSVQLFGLEKKLEEVKNKHVNIESMEGFKKFEQEKRKENANEPETKKEVSKETHPSVIKEDLKKVSKMKKKEVSMFRFGAEARETVLDEKKVEEKDKAANDIKCEFCDYKCKNNSTLKKHIKLKHGEHKCKICSKEFKVAMELVSHVAIEHQEEEEVWNVNFQSTPKSENKKENSSLDFNDGLDEFL